MDGGTQIFLQYNPAVEAAADKSRRYAVMDQSHATTLTLLVIGAYMLPTIVAHLRKHTQVAPIAVLNLLLGWTFVGWVVALIWAVAQVRRAPA